MNIYINNEPVIINDCTVTGLLDHHGLHEKTGYAVAVNEQVISKEQWSQYQIEDGDKVLIINPTQGG